MFYSFMKWVAWAVGHVLFRFEVAGMENIPKDGPFLLCANHISGLDPAVFAIFMRRRPRFMAKRELFRNRLAGRFFRALGAYPVDRGAADLSAYRATMELLKRGDGLLIFFQGTRMQELGGAKGGAALFALKSGAPIVPAGISGEYRFRGRIRLRVGEPIAMDRYAGMKARTELINEVMEQVVDKVAALA